MRVIMKQQIGGYRNGEPWPPKGGEIDVPDHEAASLISQGYAKEAHDEHPTEAPPVPASPVDDEQERSVDDDDQAGDDDGFSGAVDDEPVNEPEPAPAKKKSAKG